MAKSFNLAEELRKAGVSRMDTGRDVISYLPYDSLIPDPNNGYSMDGLEGLARSIELVGLQQPLRVKELSPDHYGLISGHRRHAAIGLILKQAPEAFPDGVPCIIDRADGSVALRELQLLLGNADNRKLTPADEAQQLERISDCIRRLEAEGYVFPGRHRDWLSKMSGMSKSKIGRLDSIKRHLSTSWLKLFTSGKLGETVAYELQKAPETWQEELYQCCLKSSPRVSPHLITQYSASNFVGHADYVDGLVCTEEQGAPCTWKAEIFRRIFERPGFTTCYGSCAYHSGCCANCKKRSTCKRVCPKFQDRAAAEAAEETAAAKAQNEEWKKEQAQRRAEFSATQKKIQEANDGIWHRLGTRRLELGLSVQSAYMLEEPDEEDISYIEEIEQNGGSDEDPLSFLDLYEVSDLCELADRLQCSLDYLYGRVGEPASVSGMDTAPEWQTGAPPKTGYYAARLEFFGKPLASPRVIWWDEGAWYNAVGDDIRQHKLDSQIRVVGWWPLPEGN